MLDFECQKSAIESLERYSIENKHSILISGIVGSGKTYLANQYARFLRIPDVVEVDAKVNEIRDAFDSLNSIDNDILVIVENLDAGQASCSHTILKQLEEPRSNIYIAVTCRSIDGIPDTVLSRCMACRIAVPTRRDLSSYESFNHDMKRIPSDLRACIRRFSDIDELYALNDEELAYISSWKNLNSKCKQPCKSIAWGLNHFENGKEIDSDVVIRYIMHAYRDNSHVVKCCLDCISSLSTRAIPDYMALSCLALNIKYCE